MADKVSIQKRSEIMRRIRGKNTTPECNLRRALWIAGIRGWRLHYRAPGCRPDLAFPKRKLAVLVHGCFFHGCPKHYRRPASNNAYWDHKLIRNMKRDRANIRTLRANGWSVVLLWEHDLSPTARAGAITRLLGKLRGRRD